MQVLKDGTHQLKRWWCRKYSRPHNDPLLLELGVRDLEQEWMEDYIEAKLEDLAEPELDKLTYEDLFPEDNPHDFETILDEVLERRGEEDDLEAAIEEAEQIYERRTGRRRGRE